MRLQPARREGLLTLPRFFIFSITLLVAMPAAAVPLETTLTVPANAPFAGFGSALDLDGDRLVVGAPWQSEPDQETLHAGAAYVFEHQGGGTWVQAAQLNAGDRDNEDYFGHAVAIHDDLILVGAPWESDAVNGKLYRGAAYLYEKKGRSWLQVDRLDAGAAEASSSFFGHAVAIGSKTVAVGAPGDGEAFGAVHIFERGQTFWTEVQRLEGDDPGGRFGSSVAVDGEVLSVAERGGSSWRVYRRSTGLGGTTWIEEDQFFDTASGFASALHGTEARVVVGAPGDDVTVAGQVHFFGAGNASWQSEGVGAAAATGIGDRFGAAVALDGHFAVVGAPGRDVPGSTDTGGAYLFSRNTAGNWQELETLSTSPANRLRFGAAVAIDGTAIAVGAPGYAGQESDDGQVSIYRLDRVAKFSASPQVAYCPPVAVQFTDESEGDITTREWDVDGDGTVDYVNPGSVFFHTYMESGIFDVTLTVSGLGGSDSDVETVNIVWAFWCMLTK